jgi:hypothetical protein
VVVGGGDRGVGEGRRESKRGAGEIELFEGGKVEGGATEEARRGKMRTSPVSGLCRTGPEPLARDLALQVSLGLSEAHIRFIVTQGGYTFGDRRAGPPLWSVVPRLCINKAPPLRFAPLGSFAACLRIAAKAGCCEGG